MIPERTVCLSKRGSIALETALFLPPLLILVVFFLAALIHERQLLVLSAALDETAAEISLSLPLSQLGSEALTDYTDSLLGKAGIEPDPWLLQSGEVIAKWASDTAWEIIFDERLNTRLKKSSTGPSKFDRTSLSDSSLLSIYRYRTIEMTHDPSYPVIWISCTWNSRVLWLPVQHVVKTSIPVWSVELADPQERSPDSGKNEIWMLENFARGQSLRQIYAANLPGDFPVIARWSEGEATLIHSMDLTAPTYQWPGEIRSAILTKLLDLAAFKGCNYQRLGTNIEITAESIKSRRMLLIIPENYDRINAGQVLAELKSKAFAMGIRLEVGTYGESYCYQQK